MLLIGKNVKVLWSKNKSQQGLEGVVVDESKNMLVIETKKGEKKIFKGQAVFLFSNKSKKIVMPGELLIGTVEKRVKRWHKQKRRLGT